MRRAWLVSLLACSAASSRREAAAPVGPAVVLRPASGAPARVRVEVARTPAERARGLMFRERLDADAGMLFAFDDERVQAFWMKNTRIALDMIFIDEAMRVVGVVENAEPMDETPRSVGRPSRYVLEVNAGWARAHGVGPGTRAELVAVR